MLPIALYWWIFLWYVTKTKISDFVNTGMTLKSFESFLR